MDRPLDIAFHNIDASESLEETIRAHVERLDERFPHLIGCRVSVEAPHHQHQTGNEVSVHITLAVPGRDLVVSHAPHKSREHRRHPDARSAVKDAFRAAERQLETFKGRLQDDDTKPSGSALAGTVALVEPGADHGFLLTAFGTQLYFHRDSLTNASLAELEAGTVVHYVEEDGDAGPVATKVRVEPRQHASDPEDTGPYDPDLI